MGLILGQYEILPGFAGEGYFVADIRHRKGDAVMPVGNLYVSPAAGGGLSSVRLYLRSDLRYDAKTGETKAVAFPENPLMSGSNRDLLYGFLHRKQTDLPYYSPALPETILQYLLEYGHCAEPLRMEIFHKDHKGVLTQAKTMSKP